MNRAKYDEYLLPLRRLSMRQDAEMEHMFDAWVRNDTPSEDRRTQFWAAMDYWKQEWRDAWRNIEKQVGEKYAKTHND